MLQTSFRFAILFAILACPIAALAADPPAKPPTKEQIAAWVKGLESDSFEEREAASKALWQAGKPADTLRRVLKTGDAEAVRRAAKSSTNSTGVSIPIRPRRSSR